MRLNWPFVRRWTYEQMRRENVLLKDALREANSELSKHRRLLADLRDASPNGLRDRAMSK